LPKEDGEATPDDGFTDAEGVALAPGDTLVLGDAAPGDALATGDTFCVAVTAGETFGETTAEGLTVGELVTLPVGVQPARTETAVATSRTAMRSFFMS
jgi:hypothetical protein